MVRLGKTSRALGNHGEDLAVAELEAQSLHIIERNWRCQHGEIDVVAYDEEEELLVFVEVKTKSGPGFGAPLEAITHGKARRLYQLAHLWRREHKAYLPFRVDGIGVQFGSGEPLVTHIKAIEA